MTPRHPITSVRRLARWDDRTRGDADKDDQGEALNQHSWSDGRKTVRIYTKLDGLNVAENASESESCDGRFTAHDTSRCSGCQRAREDEIQAARENTPGRQLYHSSFRVGRASETQSQRATEPTTIHDTNKLPTDDDSSEPLKETSASPTESQPQNNMREIARRARALLADSHGSPHVNLIFKANP